MRAWTLSQIAGRDTFLGSVRKKHLSMALLSLAVLLATGSAVARPGGGQSFVGPSQQRPAPAVQPAAPAMPPPVYVAPPADPPPDQGKTGSQWWKGESDPAPVSTEPEEPRGPDDSPRYQPQEPRSRIRANSIAFGVFMLVVAGVLIVRGVQRARENKNGPPKTK
jgi:hypothetical protein